MSVCLLPDQIAKFRQALKTKDLDIKDLINMSTKDRIAALQEYAGDNAKDVNRMFEQKLVLKNRMSGLKNWAAKLGEVGKYSDSGVGEQAMNAWLEKQVKEERVLSPDENEAFLNDLADKQLGVHVSREVAAKVFDLSQKADALKETGAKMSGVSDEYLLAKQELDQYVRSQKPVDVSTAVAKDLAVIARNNLLLNPSTPIKTIASQALNSAIDMVTRRIGALSAKGDNYDLVRAANKEAWTTFKKTGQNTAAMESLDDTSVLGEGKNFNSEGTAENGFKAGVKEVYGAIKSGSPTKMLETTARRTAQASSKIAIYYEHQIAFTKFHQKAFFDMSNLMSSKMAEAEGLTGDEVKGRAADIFKDAARIEPETREGALVRQQSQLQAARVTSTNKTWVSDIAVGAKNTLNKYTPHFPMGDIIIPIAKIPANVIWNGIENAGLGIPGAVKDIYQGRQKIQSADLNTRYEGMAQFAGGIQRAARIGGTLGTAYFLAQSIPSKDFKQDPTYGTTYVKIGNTWINTEYFTAISPALSGFMAVKANALKGKKAINPVSAYGLGAGKGLAELPGLSDIAGVFKDPGKYASDFFTSRGAPAFIPNLLNNRPIDRLFWGAHGVESQEDVNQDKKANPKALI